MTSKEKAMVSLPVSPWDAILKAAKDQLPSLDSDSSSSDGEEEEPFIFQRNQPLLIPDLAEELAEDPIGVDESGIWFAVGSSSPEPLLVPERLAIEPRSEQKVRQKDLAALERRVSGWSCQSCVKSSPIVVDAEEVLPWLEGNLRSLPNPKGSQSPPWPSQGKEATFPLEGELKTERSNTDFRNSAKRRALRKERRKMIERDILQKVTQAALSPASGDQRQAAKSGPWPEATSEQSQEGRPVLSLQYLEGWDLDYILQSLPGRQDSQGDSEPRTAWWLADRWQDQGHTTALSQDTLLEQLALLCASQSRGRNPTWKLSAEKLQDTEEQKARSSSEYSSSDSEEEEVETAGSVQVASSREQRDCTGKSQLLQQLRAFRKGAIPPQLSASASPGGQKVQAAEDTAGSHTGMKKHVKLWAEKQNALDIGDPIGKQPAREVLLPAVGQL
ncbi:dynein axonemal assembly factor 8 isoform X2 [Psammomys obesus]|uniref:dynein axonemal assembly factor 8 isoform X2 n=1 Tax=Psammomys obesus TaxID=48139 RepID=UPI002452A681|nr:dynein axonemal assembly factor 8 isoform X2 [Psammomys obesus]